MLEKPSIPDEKISTYVRAEFGLRATDVNFLPLGADRNTAVYKVFTEGPTPYFLKLRSGPFNEVSVTLPKFLRDQGISQIIAPLPAKSGELWANLEGFNAILYPFIDGLDGYQVGLSERQWVEFGKTLHGIHAVELPAWLSGCLRRETYSPTFRKTVHAFIENADRQTSSDPISRETRVVLKKQRPVILHLLGRAEELVASLQHQSLDFCLCHADIHAGNMLIEPDGALHIVDWDEAILAPKERDLMSIGANLFGGWRSPVKEEKLFYQGYGQTPINGAVLAYYRHERIIADLALECQQIFETDGKNKDREQALKFLLSNFQPGGTIALARRT